MDPTDVIGGQLLYESDSIQHYGLCFKLIDRRSRMWRNEHELKGLPMRPIGQERPFRVEAVTAAAMLIQRDFFMSLGGFNEDYIFGDYEDSDLCLRARVAGAQVKLAPDLIFFHLEGHGSPRSARGRAASLINRALFSETWDQTIASITEITRP